jgi:hypothetical protein
MTSTTLAISSLASMLPTMFLILQLLLMLLLDVFLNLYLDLSGVEPVEVTSQGPHQDHAVFKECHAIS